ncbi:MAG TPA: hypothetical protein VE398_26750 [Acidobacteriota bacterium]|nr:hypothetical protein [Acidobacteriota bacterium]
MQGKERSREVFAEPPGQEYWSRKAKDGWRLVAAEWEREAAPTGADVTWIEELPFGMKVGDDTLHLVENSKEKEALILMLEMIVADKPLSEVAESVNNRGFRTRSGAKWTQLAIFNMLPRLVEVASRVYPTQDWSERREKLIRLVR